MAIRIHAGRYAGLPLRWLYFASGLFWTAMVATGAVLWTAKRRKRLPDPSRPPLGFRIVERLNVATIVGFPIGLGCYFLANQLLSADLALRPEREITALFAAWGLAAAWALVRAPRRAWPELCAAAAAVFAAVPACGLVMLGPSWTLAARHGSALYPTVDGLILVAAGLLALAASRTGLRRPAAGAAA